MELAGAFETETHDHDRARRPAKGAQPPAFESQPVSQGGEVLPRLTSFRPWLIQVEGKSYRC